MKTKPAWLAFALLMVPCCAAAELNPDNLIIENIRLVQGQDDQAVSVVITDGKLELVTSDRAAARGSHQSLDAAGGYLLGRLEIDSAPDIIIVGEDPTDNFDVFWDLRENAVFALRDGEVLKNTLAISSTQNARTDAPVVRADYGAMPVALPLRYWNPEPFNHWETENTTGLFSAIIALDRQRWLSQNHASRQSVGDLEEFDGGVLRAFQFGVIGSLNQFERPWTYMIFAASNEFDRGFDVEEADDLTFVDYWLDVPLDDNSNLVLGRHKEPLSMERTISLVNIPVQERSAPVDAFLPSRNFGVSINGATTGRELTWKAGVYRNFIDSDESFSDTASELIARSSWVPWASAGDEDLLHLGLGFRYSTAEEGVSYTAGGELSESPDFISTGLIEADGALTGSLELGLMYGPLWLQAEYLESRVDPVAGGDLDFNGHYLSASLVLTGETRGYNRRYGYFTPFPVARSIDHGGWGAVELATRWSHLDLNDGGVAGGELDVFSIGANWWLKPSLYLTFALRRSRAETLDGDGWATGALSRVVMIVK